MIDLSQQEILRALSWAAGCDGESFIRDEDWPLVKKLAERISINPASVVPGYASDIGVDARSGFQFDMNWSPGG